MTSAPLQYSQKCSKAEYYFEMETNYIKMSLELIKSRTVSANIKPMGGLGVEGYRVELATKGSQVEVLTDSYHLLLDLFPDPRYPKEQGGLDLLQGVGQGSLQGVLVCEVGRPVAGHENEDVEDVCGDVTQREVADETLELRNKGGIHKKLFSVILKILVL